MEKRILLVEDTSLKYRKSRLKGFLPDTQAENSGGWKTANCLTNA